MGQLSSIRFEHNGKVYETYEPYFIVARIANQRNISIKNLLLLELLRGQKLNSSKSNDK
jgi:hypothetical protein